MKQVFEACTSGACSMVIDNLNDMPNRQIYIPSQHESLQRMYNINVIASKYLVLFKRHLRPSLILLHKDT